MAEKYDGTYSTGSLYGIISRDDLASHVLKGFAEDSMYSIETPNQRFTGYDSADGNHSRAHTPIRRKDVTVTLAQTSSSNDILTALLESDAESLNGTFNFSLMDKSGRFFLRSTDCYITTDGDNDFSNEIETREWVIVMPFVDDFMIGGNGYLSTEEVTILTTLGFDVQDRWVRG